MTLEVQICTFTSEGLMRVACMNLPTLDKVIYTICLQNPSESDYNIPDSLLRSDIRVLEHHSTGLSVNRNYGLNNAVGDIILIADDDLKYNDEGLTAVLQTFEENSEIDFATFMHTGGGNKKFPPFGFDFARKAPKGYYITSFEIALRRSSLPDDLRFSTLLGIGSPQFEAGEECVFVHRMIKSGLNGRFFPKTIVCHEGLTTGTKPPSPAFLRSQGLWLWIKHGYINGLPRVILYSFRKKNNKISNLKYLLSGFFKAHRFFRKDGSEKA